MYEASNEQLLPQFVLPGQSLQNMYQQFSSYSSLCSLLELASVLVSCSSILELHNIDPLLKRSYLRVCVYGLMVHQYLSLCVYELREFEWCQF